MAAFCFSTVGAAYGQIGIHPRQKLRSGATSGQVPVMLKIQETREDEMVRWANANSLDQVAASSPEIGPLHDSLLRLRARLTHAGIRLVLLDRAEDLRIRPFTSGGFFPFWEHIRKMLVTNSGKHVLSEGR